MDNFIRPVSSLCDILRYEYRKYITIYTLGKWGWKAGKKRVGVCRLSCMAGEGWGGRWEFPGKGKVRVMVCHRDGGVGGSGDGLANGEDGGRLSRGE
jgi:hypothetical protein